jgi:hypothetical protein
MTLEQALDIADQVAPMPYLARQALDVLRVRLCAQQRLLEQIRDHAGATCDYADLPEVVAGLRRSAQP